MPNDADSNKAADWDSHRESQHRFQRDLAGRLVNSKIAVPLLAAIAGQPPDSRHDVIVELNVQYPLGLSQAKEVAKGRVENAVASISASEGSGLLATRGRYTENYLFAHLSLGEMRVLLENDAEVDPSDGQPGGAIDRLWLDHDVEGQLTESVRTVKADAARTTFGADGKGVVWAVMDSGIERDHPHFSMHKNLYMGWSKNLPFAHRDFTGGEAGEFFDPGALVDDYGHGTHVAGIIAGELRAESFEDITKGRLEAYRYHKTATGETTVISESLDHISGVAPATQLISLKVLNGNGQGKVSSILDALAYVNQINGHGLFGHIAGVNLSVGYEFDAEWYACGKSPLCNEVDRLARSGVVVVTAAGNTGYGYAQTYYKGAVTAGLDLTINDPGNSQQAITVGSTHRRDPHTYGVSFFSSKGPTFDGRLKPDLVAPGERIVSCAAGDLRQDMLKGMADALPDLLYLENSGTSMAAPHVSGAIAGFLSVHREFVMQADRVKEIFLSTATNLSRDRNFQGHGLVDLMRAVQSL